MGNFLADFYAVNGLVLESRKRREHLSEEDILRNKAIMESLSKVGGIGEQNFEVISHISERLRSALSLTALNLVLLLSSAGEEEVPHGADPQHHFLGRVHNRRARKVSAGVFSDGISCS